MKIIHLTGVNKSFVLPHEKRDTLKENLVNILKKRTFEHFKALDNVNLSLEKGDFFGIIGKNGSGKSTLLKIMAQIYAPDSGKVEIEGKVVPFLELGIGFQPELTARENIMINATLLGLNPKTIKQKFKEIVDFAEVKNFLDLKIKNFSSGMLARLAFAIASHTEADIYLCDEVLAVGDEAFQQKCFAVFERWKKEGKTIVLVSHNPGLISQFCNRGMLLDKGKIILTGNTENVLNEYHRRLSVEQEKESKIQAADFTNSDLNITDVRFFSSHGEEKSSFSTGDDIVAKIFYKIKKPISQPVFGVAIHNDNGVHISGPNTKTSHFAIPKLEKNGYIECLFPKNLLLAGRYYLSASCFDSECQHPYDYADKKFLFTLEKNRENQYGVIEMPVIWKHYEHE